MVSVGLLLLPKAVPMLVAILKVPFVLRPLISEAVIEGGLPSSLSASGTQWLRRLYACARLAATVYLLCGAPQLVRWQLRRAVNRKRRSD
jgi:hypothetical protein